MGRIWNVAKLVLIVFHGTVHAGSEAECTGGTASTLTMPAYQTTCQLVKDKLEIHYGFDGTLITLCIKGETNGWIGFGPAKSNAKTNDAMGGSISTISSSGADDKKVYLMETARRPSSPAAADVVTAILSSVTDGSRMLCFQLSKDLPNGQDGESLTAANFVFAYGAADTESLAYHPWTNRGLIALNLESSKAKSTNTSSTSSTTTPTASSPAESTSTSSTSSTTTPTASPPAESTSTSSTTTPTASPPAGDLPMKTDMNKCDTISNIVPHMAPCMVELSPGSDGGPHFEIHYGYDTDAKEVSLCAVNRMTNDWDFRGWVAFGPGTNKDDAKVVTAEGPRVGESEPGPVSSSLLPRGNDAELEDFTSGQVMNEELDDGRCVCFNLGVEKLGGAPLDKVRFVWAIGDKPRVDGVIDVGGTIDLDFLSSLSAATTTAAPTPASPVTPAAVPTTTSPVTPEACDDSWVSVTGSTCQRYKDKEYCTESGGEGNGWTYQPATFSDYPDERGRTALVCTVCGCGTSVSRETAGKTTAASPATTTATIAAATAATTTTTTTTTSTVEDSGQKQGVLSTTNEEPVGEARDARTSVTTGLPILIVVFSVILLSLTAAMFYIHYGRTDPKTEDPHTRLPDEEAIDSSKNSYMDTGAATPEDGQRGTQWKTTMPQQRGGARSQPTPKSAALSRNMGMSRGIPQVPTSRAVPHGSPSSRSKNIELFS